MSYYTANKEVEFISCPSKYIAAEGASRENRDLLLGKAPISIEELVPLPDDNKTDYYNSPVSNPALTDGMIDYSATYTSPAWFHFTRGIDRTVTFRLDNLSAVNRFEVCFLRDESIAVRPPRKLFILLSENGKDWEVVSRDSRLTCVFEKDIVTKRIELEAPRKALYVRFKFDVACHVWCGRLSAYGSTEIPENAKDIVASEAESVAKQTIYNKYPDYNALLGVHNVLLSYNCLPKDRVKNGEGFITEEQYLPYVAYLDKDMKIKDTMFDAYLYLPYTAFNYADNAKTAEGWHYYIDNCFAKGRNLEALDKTVGRVKDELNLPDYKVHVFFSLLYTFTTATSFGDLDGSGKCLNFTKIEDRKTAIKWAVEEYIRRYNEKHTKNTVLGGFYWFEESIAFADEHELDLIAYARDLVHSHGMKFFWIPWYQAGGFADWQEVGFDIACMQPNYAFNDKIPVSRLYDNADITKKLGMCVEMESFLHGDDPFHINKFKDYMDCGAETGYMHSVKMYYQGGVPGDFYNACHSSDAECRSLYDDLHLYIKEKYVSRKDR